MKEIRIILSLLWTFQINSFAECGILHLNLNSVDSGITWTATGLRDDKRIVVSATVPGGIYSDLAANGSIFESEIYFGYNDVETRWVGRSNWTFQRSFTVSSEVLAKQRIKLICNGLDTVAALFINDLPVGSSENMFVRYEYNIKNTLKLGVNVLRVDFQSPVEYAKKQWIRQNRDYPVPPVCVPYEYHGECHANHIRKMQASFAWDWGPAYPSSGIWKDIYIEAFNGAVIRDAMLFISSNSTNPERSGTLWNVTARVWIDISDPNSKDSEHGQLSLQIEVENSKKYLTSKQISLKIGDSCNSSFIQTDVALLIPGNEVKLWWPNGYGSPSLYDFNITYTFLKYKYSDSRVLRSGFRTVDLVEDPIDSDHLEKGLTFYFRVNGIPIYAKGTNSIPIHVLPERVTSNMTEWLLESAKEANMNMIRVWGGGIYESDLFYKLADEKGLMIWQDFMFACAMYPANEAFLENVRQEVETQVKRLQYHPSIVIWAANNENEAALRDNWYGTEDNFTQYARDFVKLYINTIKTLVNILDPSRECLSSSPTNGAESEVEGWIAKNPYLNLYGDVHFYDYKNDSWDWRIFPKTRFASEYGFQSWPIPETLITGTSKDDWHWFPQMINHHQHHPGGQMEILNQIKLHLPIPKQANGSSAFISMIYMSQITQAMSMKIETESYRRLKGQMYENGEGHNSGALYWQLNDIWQGASWASIDIMGRWKMLHYYARNFFSRIIMSPYETENGDIGIYVVSDAMRTFSGILRIRLFELDKMTPLWAYEVPIVADKFSAKEVHVIPKSQIELCSNSVSICLLYLTMAGTPDNFLFLHYPNETSFIQDPKLKISSTSSLTDGRTFLLTLETQAIAPFVFLNMRDNNIHGWFSENGFIMVNRRKTLIFRSKEVLSLHTFEENLELRSLYDSIY